MSAAMFRGGVLLLALGLAACDKAADAAGQASTAMHKNEAARTTATPAVPAEPTVAVTLGEVAGVRIGQAFDELKGLGEWESHGMTEVIGEGCEYYDGGPLPASISMMVIDDKVARFDLGGTDPGQPLAQAGPFGLRIGMTRAEVMGLFPSPPTSSPHAYDGDQGEYLTWRQPGTALGLRLEMSEGKVALMYWGNGEEIQLIEGCA
ncbi:hypothetical protein [Marilutibacter alkalisoli]|uniref:Lipoprotein n=1 Tax=Marilutibacter alkalisoli TaxID=2591633 RepID=A0A514BQZ2_9GAMM|nr:hypothetical protein [Lysobacter alkalisoli]QDH69810.1 hypothetical protein FKV23_06660 [Lysobacter alkalisoli]